MPDFFSEPFLHLAGLTHKSALIAWGAFYFRVKDSGKEFKLADDDLDRAAEHHFLLATVEGTRMTVRPIAELGAGGALSEIRRRAPDKSEVKAPIVINLA